MQSNNRNISKAIKKATGLNIKIYKKDGCCSFYSDDNETQSKLGKLYSKTVYVNSMQQLSIQQWVDEFMDIIKDFE